MALLMHTLTFTHGATRLGFTYWSFCLLAVWLGYLAFLFAVSSYVKWGNMPHRIVKGHIVESIKCVNTCKTFTPELGTYKE